MKKGFTLAAMILAISFYAPFALAWGAKGHRITGQIAQTYLTPKAAEAIKQLLDGYDLAQVSTWADDLRSDPAWGKADVWHYATIEDGQAYSKPADEKDGLIYEKLVQFEAQLRDPKTSKAEKAEALKWLVHLIGDIHQPLHVGKAGDYGGNNVTVTWFDQLTNLHTVWDSEMIEKEGWSYTEFARYLLVDLSPELQGQYATGNYLDWMAESQAVRGKAYEVGKRNLPKLRYEYAYQVMPIVRQRLRQGGVRLAAKLNDIFK